MGGGLSCKWRLGRVSYTQPLIQTEPNHQPHGDTDANEHPHDHGANGAISAGEFLRHVERRKLVDDEVTEPHEHQRYCATENCIDEVYNDWAQGMSPSFCIHPGCYKNIGVLTMAMMRINIEKTASRLWTAGGQRPERGFHELPAGD